MSENKNTARPNEFLRALSEKLLILDGSTGVEFQRLHLSEEEVRGDRFADHDKPLAADFDVLCLTRPYIVASVHERYLAAGADIIETNTFNSNRLSQKEYGLEHLVREICREGAAIARRAADRFTAADQSKPRFVAGSIGPTALSASLPTDVNDPTARSVSFAELADAYAEQAAGLIEGGADFLLVETAFDLINAKAAAEGIRRASEETGISLPTVYSFTVSDASGRILSGQSPDAILAAMAPYAPAALGFNCSAGPDKLAPIVADFAAKSPFPVIFYPNAGLPDQMGNYTVSPEEFASSVAALAKAGSLNIAGGCCGTTPEHIRALAEALSEVAASPRRSSTDTAEPWLAGLEPFFDNRGFINVGERCNVAGSRKFLRLIKENNLEEALAIARKQVNDGAMILDINMDDAMLDSRREMSRFLRVLGSDPATASVPWMIDSSDFGVIEGALNEIGGRAIVNSISLKHGEEEFIRQASVIRRFGAAVVVMLFDEQGQATTLERKKEVASRAISLLTEKCGFERRDIIIDPNVLTIATGMPEHDAYALWFIEAVRWINRTFPGVKTSGGVSNLSFAFRGNNQLRQSMHAVFLYHAVKAGLSMGIVDPGTKVAYTDIPAHLLEKIEDAVLCRHERASEALAAAAGEFAGVSAEVAPTDSSERTDKPVAQRLAEALRQGDDSRLAADIPEAVATAGSASAVVEGMLMNGMEEVGRLFEQGKMFLPQVVKSARTMHHAVDLLRPYLEKESGDVTESRHKGTAVIATVKGDVHDIGKNIAAVVLRCNNYRVIDLGVQVDAAAIVAAVKEYHPDFVALSGLISPSLEEMARTLQALRDNGISVPVFVGGAATSEVHTAVRLAPAYSPGLVVRVADASQDPLVASRLASDFDTESGNIRRRQSECARDFEVRMSATQASQPKAEKSDWEAEDVTAPTFTGVRTLEPIPVREVIPYINWTYFYHCWRIQPDSPEAESLKGDADALLDRIVSAGGTMRAQVAFYNANSDGDTIKIGDTTIAVPRQHPKQGRSECLSLADFVAPEGHEDYIGCFAVTTGPELRAFAADDEYESLILQSVCDRLAEACSEWLHRVVRTELWGYAPDEKEDLQAIMQGRYRGIRPAVGYPSLPDQKLMHKLLGLLKPSEISVRATENGALIPASTVAGFYIASPRARYFTL